MTSTARPAAPAQPLPSARLLDLADLPIERTDIELSAPGDTLWPENATADTQKILALVRLHGHPLGVVVLDGNANHHWRTHSATVWSALRDAIDSHLAADGLPPAREPDDLIAGHGALPRCIRRRRAVLADAPPITVVVATRERPDSLWVCLDSLLSMEYVDFEIVVVDNDPQTSRTADLIADRFAPLVRYVRENRRGLASAHNCGLAQAQGQIVAFVDDDVVVDRHWLTGIAEGFAATSQVGCVTGLILPAQLDTPAQLLLERHGGFDKGFKQRIVDTDSHRPQDPLFPFTPGRLGSGANMAFDVEVLRRLGGFDSAIGAGTFARGGDDLAAFFRVVVSGQRLVYQPSAVVWHRHHREMAALHNQAFGYGVGLGAYLTSALVHEPRMWGALLRRLPAGIAYAFNRKSARNHQRYDGLPSALARLEKRGLVFGPAAYAVSRLRAHRAAKRDN